MASIIKEFYEEYSDMKLIGKVFRNNSSPDFSQKWYEAFQENFFEPLDSLDLPSNFDNGYVGLMKWDVSNPMGYEYWIGVFTTLDTKVPEGYESIIVPASKAIVFYLKGQDGRPLYDLEGACFQLINKKKLELFVDKNNNSYCFERYNCPRFTEADENNEVILDYITLIK